MVIYLMTEDRYNKFTQEENPLKQEISIAIENENNSILNDMTNFEKWIYFIFKKEININL
jgi:hypothetical protein